MIRRDQLFGPAPTRDPLRPRPASTSRSKREIGTSRFVGTPKELLELGGKLIAGGHVVHAKWIALGGVE